MLSHEEGTQFVTALSTMMGVDLHGYGVCVPVQGVVALVQSFTVAGIEFCVENDHVRITKRAPKSPNADG